MIILKEFLTKESFAEQIEAKVLGGQTYFEAVIEFADDTDKSPEELLPFFSQSILDKLKMCAVQEGMIDLKEGNLNGFFE